MVSFIASSLLRLVLLLCCCCLPLLASSATATTATSTLSSPSSSSSSAASTSYELTREQIQTYRRDGVIVVRGLLQGQELHDAIQAVQKLQRRKSLGQRLLYKLNPLYRNFEFQTWRRDPALEYIAFDSCAPHICARLMGLDKNVDRKDGCLKRPLRLLKDAVLGYSVGDKGCGWHVDDKMFWPCEDRNVGQRDAGINVWITLSPISIAEGGGLAVAPTSHRRWFARKARNLIASKGSQTTCALQTLAPKLHDKMEQLKCLYDLQPGDAIIHNRYVFHRAEPFVDEKTKSGSSNTKQRISLRYVPADATYFGSEVSTDIVVQEKGLKTGDAISKGGAYFPQTWPTYLDDERSTKVLEDKNPFTLMKIYKMIRMQQQMKKQKQQTEKEEDANNKSGGYV